MKVYPRPKNITRAEKEGLTVATDILDDGEHLVVTIRTSDGMILQRTLIDTSKVVNGIIFIGIDSKNTNDAKNSIN